MKSLVRVREKKYRVCSSVAFAAHKVFDSSIDSEAITHVSDLEGPLGFFNGEAHFVNAVDSLVDGVDTWIRLFEKSSLEWMHVLAISSSLGSMIVDGQLLFCDCVVDWVV